MSETFKKPKRQFNVRKRRASDHDNDSDSEESDSSVGNSIHLLKEVQKMRQRQKGVNAEVLAKGQTQVKKDKGPIDPFKLKTGGCVDMKAIKRGITEEALDDDLDIGTSFAVETNRRDEDADMIKYVEEEMSRRKGITKEEETVENKIKTAEDSLYTLPEHLKALSKTKKTEDMLSNQMLSGIPEVDLGIDAKIKNIEATEEAKHKLVEDKKKQKTSSISFVPTNMAVNFVQHNRFNIEDNAPIIKKQPEAPKPAPLRVGDADVKSKDDAGPSKKEKGEKATDDFHYEKFKKQMRRY